MAIKFVSLQVYKALTKASQKTLSRAAKIVAAMGGGRTVYRKGKKRGRITISRRSKGREIFRSSAAKERALNRALRADMGMAF